MPFWTVSIKDNPKTPAKVTLKLLCKDSSQRQIQSSFLKKMRQRVKS